MPKPNSKPEDIDNPDWSKTKTFPLRLKDIPALQTAVTRGAQKFPLKKPVTIRLSADVADSLRASGKGWQSRADAALREWILRSEKVSAK